MRPLVLVSSLATGGAERVTASLLCRLRRQGHDVALCTVTARHDGPLAEEVARQGVVRFDLGADRLADPRVLLRLLRLLRCEGFGLVHAHGQDASILALAARPWARLPLVVTRHVLEEPAADARQRARALAALLALRLADAAVAVSHAVARRLASAGWLDRDRIRVIPNGIELERFDPVASSASRAATRRALGVGPDEPLALVPAVLRPRKGHPLLLEAVPRIRERVPGARLLFAGSGPLEGELRRHAAPLGDAVRFLGERGDVPALMAAADLVVLATETEALPTVLMEAAAAGRPAVASDVGGVGEVVAAGRTGLLVPVGDAGALADAVGRLLLDCDRARALGAAARALAEERFGMDLYVRRTLELWRETARGRQP